VTVTYTHTPRKIPHHQRKQRRQLLLSTGCSAATAPPNHNTGTLSTPHRRKPTAAAAVLRRLPKPLLHPQVMTHNCMLHLLALAANMQGVAQEHGHRTCCAQQYKRNRSCLVTSPVPLTMHPQTTAHTTPKYRARRATGQTLEHSHIPLHNKTAHLKPIAHELSSPIISHEAARALHTIGTWHACLQALLTPACVHTHNVWATGVAHTQTRRRPKQPTTRNIPATNPRTYTQMQNSNKHQCTVQAHRARPLTCSIRAQRAASAQRQHACQHSTQQPNLHSAQHAAGRTVRSTAPSKHTSTTTASAQAQQQLQSTPAQRAPCSTAHSKSASTAHSKRACKQAQRRACRQHTAHNMQHSARRTAKRTAQHAAHHTAPSTPHCRCHHSEQHPSHRTIPCQISGSSRRTSS
jgi:hypothetical protein